MFAYKKRLSTWFVLVFFALQLLPFISKSVRPALAAPQTVTFQVSSGADDVNEVSTSFDAGSSTVWVGTGGSATASFSGFRFTNVTIPRNAQITSAAIELRSTQSQWLSVGYQLAAENTGNSAPFTTSSRPSARALTSAVVNHSSNVQWLSNTWYQTNDISTVVQEVVSRQDWSTGNSMSFVLRGNVGTWGRKFASSFEAGSLLAPRLVVTYEDAGGSSPTPTPMPSPSPTGTLTPTPTPSSTPSPTPMPSPSPGVSKTSFEVGLMGSDVIPHQIVRTSSDKIYMFGYVGDLSTQIKGYWTSAAGLPSGTADFDGETTLNESEGIISVEVSYDGANTIHVLTNTKGGKLKDYPFDLITNTFKPGIVIATGLPTNNTQVGTSGLSAMFSSDQALNIAYWSNGNHITYQSFSYDSTFNTLTGRTPATQLDGAESNNNANHPSMAISPVDSSVTVAWIVGTSGQGNIFSRVLSGGNWSAPVQVNTAPLWTSPNSGINIDQGPSMVIGANGTKYLTYIQDWENVNGTFIYGRVHFVSNSGSGWIDTALNVFTNDPAVSINDAGEIFVIGHGNPSNVSCQSMEDMCITKRDVNGVWSNPEVFAAKPAGGGFDTSPSVKWSVVGYNRPESIEFIFPNTIDGSYSNTTIYYGRIDSNSPTPTPSPTPTLTPSPTPSPSPSVTPTLTPSPTATLTPSPTPSPSPGLLTAQVSSANDDVNQINSTLDAGQSTVWLGNASGTSRTALRFNNVALPQGATITNAYLEVYSSQSQWQNMAFSIRGDNVGNSAAFSTSSLPSARVLTSAVVNHSSNISWNANTWYQLNNISSVVQEIVNRGDWTSGNSMSLILQGTGGNWARKFIRSYNGNAAQAPKLIITYQ